MPQAEETERQRFTGQPPTSTRQDHGVNNFGQPEKVTETGFIPLSYGATPSDAIMNEKFTSQIQSMIDGYKSK